MVISGELRNLEEVIESFASQEQVYRQARDRRSVFLTIYLMMSSEMKRRIEAGEFLDNQWMTRYVVAFANFYVRALAAYERGDLEAVPKAWRIAFDASRSGDSLVLQDLLLGINAHINNDLALALHGVSIDPGRQRRYDDHVAVNTVLGSLMDPAEKRIGEMYAPALARLGEAVRPLDRVTAGFSLEVARESAWEAAVSLANARSEFERGLVRKGLNLRSAVLARLILVPNVNPTLLDALRRFEQGADWWNWLPGGAYGVASSSPLP